MSVRSSQWPCSIQPKIVKKLPDADDDTDDDSPSAADERDEAGE